MVESRRPSGSRKPKKARNGYVLPDEKLKQREAAFAVYRDMGPLRSIPKLDEMLRKKFPELSVTRSSLERWSRLRDWHHRVVADLNSSQFSKKLPYTDEGAESLKTSR